MPASNPRPKSKSKTRPPKASKSTLSRLKSALHLFRSKRTSPQPPTPPLRSKASIEASTIAPYGRGQVDERIKAQFASRVQAEKDARAVRVLAHEVQSVPSDAVRNESRAERESAERESAGRSSGDIYHDAVGEASAPWPPSAFTFSRGAGSAAPQRYRLRRCARSGHPEVLTPGYRHGTIFEEREEEESDEETRRRWPSEYPTQQWSDRRQSDERRERDERRNWFQTPPRCYGESTQSTQSTLAVVGERREQESKRDRVLSEEEARVRLKVRDAIFY